MTHAVGDALAPFVIPGVSPEAMRQWSVFLADPNPIHLDVAVVKAKGLGDRVINQGPINVAYMMNMLMTMTNMRSMRSMVMSTMIMMNMDMHMANMISIFGLILKLQKLS